MQEGDVDMLLAVVRALRHHGWHPAPSFPDAQSYPANSGQPARAAKEAVLDGVLPRGCFNGWPGEDRPRTSTGEQAYACLLVLHEAGVPDEILDPFLEAYGLSFTREEPVPASDDVLAESSEVDDEELGKLKARVVAGNFAVPDAYVTAKTRGSAQSVFASIVKPNYGWKCALTGISTREFLVASHIVPWSQDEEIRLDPANGICLSTLVDKAFDSGFLIIREDYSVQIAWNRVGTDDALKAALEPYDDRRLTLPSASPPNPDFLRRRLEKT